MSPPRQTPLTCLTTHPGETRLTHTGEIAMALYARRVVKAWSVFALVNVCNTRTQKETLGIFSQLINLSATRLPSFCKNVPLAAKVLEEALILLCRLIVFVFVR